MRVHLLNSAMMPKEGTYNLVRIDKEIFKMLLEKYYTESKLVNYIGYEQNLKLISEWCNIRLVANRDEAKNLESGDILLIMKLKYRVKNINNKSDKNFQAQLTENDFDFFEAKFE